MGTSVQIFDDVTDLLPNVRYSFDRIPSAAQSGPRAICDLVVHGRVATVERGVAFADFDETEQNPQLSGRPDSTQVDFDDPNADWRTVHITVDVLDRLGAEQAKEPARVRVGLVMASADFETTRQALLSRDSYVFFLRKNSPVFAYDDSLYYIVGDGYYLTAVGDNGQLSLPAATAGSDQEQFFRQADTLAEIKTRARGPVVTKVADYDNPR